MDAVRFAIKNPVSVVVGIILLVLFGYLGLTGLPIQLTPSVEQPEISVETIWPGATPYEIEREIIEEQEDVLKGIPRLVEMSSESSNDFGSISLKFSVGTDINTALLRVSNKLDEVPDYPDNVEKPIISATGSATSPVIWTILKPLPGNETPIRTYQTFFEDEVRQYLERVPGVADLFIFGGSEDEMHVVLDPVKLAAHKLTISQVAEVLARENANVSAGNMYVGRRSIRVRTVGEYQSPAEIEAVVVVSDGQRRITVGDVGRAEPGYAKLEGAMIHNGADGIVCGIEPIPGANILDMTDAAEAVVNDLNNGLLKERGVYLDWAYDQRPYINGAIDLVQQNIVIGGVMAAIVLLVYLQSLSSTLVVAAAIPISILGAFIVMSLLGRNLNVVSLAGISFAVGMLVDNAIVVLENIDRHRKMGKNAFRAAYEGAVEVIGAVVASTATTVAVFLPVVFIQEEAGQLFKDIAIAVTAAIFLSMLVSVGVIPMLSEQLYRRLPRNDRPGLGKTLWAPVRGLGAAASGLIMGAVRLALSNVATRLATIGLFTAAAILFTIALFPKMEYLPQGNQNLILNILIPPPGLSYQERYDIGHKIVYDGAKEHIGQDVGGVPAIEDLFYVGHPRIMLFGAVAEDDDRPRELIPFFNRLMAGIPGFFGVSIQASIFDQELGGGRNIDVDLSAGDMEQLAGGAMAMFGALMGTLPGAQVRPIPSLELTFPEVRLIPDRDRLRAVGLTTRDLGVMADVLMDGRDVAEYKKEGETTIDLKLMASEQDIATPEALYDVLVALPDGEVAPVSTLAELERTSGITQIRHLERKRTITLQVTPPETMPLEAAMETIQSGVVSQLKQGPLKGIEVTLSGAADKLTTTRQALQGNFILAVVITYLLMSALFGNFVYPLVILFTVPLAGAGGILGLTLQNLLLKPQALDVVTMLGFIILVGVVVNNAILIVHQALNNMRHRGMQARDAVLDSVQTRLRPIYMSATTSIFGMLPLAVSPGPGSELYAGLGSVVLGGLAVSTFFTIFVIPCLLLFFLWMETPHLDDEECFDDKGDPIRCP